MHHMQQCWCALQNAGFSLFWEREKFVSFTELQDDLTLIRSQNPTDSADPEVVW